MINEGIPSEIESSKSQLFECTGFWEYLNPDRKRILGSYVKSYEDSDTFVLTALVDNPQQALFDKMGFKQLHPRKQRNL